MFSIWDTYICAAGDSLIVTAPTSQMYVQYAELKCMHFLCFLETLTKNSDVYCDIS